MNPKYKFVIVGKSTNLLNPENSTIGATHNISPYMRVQAGQTYVLMGADNQTKTIESCFIYDRFKSHITSYLTPRTSITIPSNGAYIIIRFQENPYEVGFFKSPFAVFEPYSKGYVRPAWKSLEIEWDKEGQHVFFRRKLNGKLTFLNYDYDYIMSKNINTQFDVQIWLDNGTKQTMPYWEGYFYWTDCEIDEDSKTVIVTPTVDDGYGEILENYEREFDLIKLAPPITQIDYDKRLVLQLYIKGRDSITCMQRGTYWEQSANSCDDHTTLNNDYGMARLKRIRVITLSGASDDDINNIYYQNYAGDNDLGGGYTYYGKTKDDENNGYRLTLTKTLIQSNQYAFLWELYNSQDVLIASYQVAEQYNFQPLTFDLTGDGETITANFEIIDIYGRYLSDVPEIDGVAGHPLTSDDLTFTINYKYSYAMTVSGFASYIQGIRYFQQQPTEWGMYDNMYYKLIPSNLETSPIPLNRDSWGELSFWFDMEVWTYIPQTFEQYATKTVTLKNAYKIADVIDIILQQFSGLHFYENFNHSRFLYANKDAEINPYCEVDLFITPKSNILKSGYDTPAQKAPITLKLLMDAMQAMYRCYWYIEDGRFKIEHITYFMNGKSYTSQPNVGRDLTQEIVTRNGKKWAFAQNKYQFEKYNMPYLYQFGWADEVTQTFIGQPIEVVSPYVQKGNIEEIQVNMINTDVDYMLVNPSGCAEDGFAILGCIDGKVAYYPAAIQSTERFQNWYLSFTNLQKFYRYDLPAWSCRIGGNNISAYGIKKTKIQEVSFPAINDPDTYETIKTGIGEGEIKKLSINLSSRQAKTTLCYVATEQ